MPDGTPLSGLGWEHPRCRRPLEEVSRLIERTGGPTVLWSFRSLEAFNDQPVSAIAAQFDLIVLDHPMVPAGFRHLTPLGPRVLQAHQFFARSAACYEWEGDAYAVPVDLACQVSAWSSRRGAVEWLPATWFDVIDLARSKPHAVALPLAPADAVCTLMTISQSLGHNVTFEAPFSPRALELLFELADLLGPAQTQLTPPRLLDRFAVDDSLRYCPSLFGYATAVADSAASPITYGAVPGGAESKGAGVLGGAGLAVSALSSRQSAALEYLRSVASPDGQRAMARAGGQPAGVHFWDAPESGAPEDHFVRQTREATRAAFIRPLDPRFSGFHKEAGDVLSRLLAGGGSSEAALRALRSLHEQLVLTSG